MDPMLADCLVDVEQKFLHCDLRISTIYLYSAAASALGQIQGPAVIRARQTQCQPELPQGSAAKGGRWSQGWRKACWWS